VAERSLAWLVGYRRLQVRDERRADILLGFLQLAAALICRNRLDRPSAAPWAPARPLTDRGTQRLKGVEGDWQLFAVEG
jgi:hypothetical protein